MTDYSCPLCGSQVYLYHQNTIEKKIVLNASTGNSSGIVVKDNSVINGVECADNCGWGRNFAIDEVPEPFNSDAIASVLNNLVNSQ